MLTGTLPWKGQKADTKKEKNKAILKIKQESTRKGILYEDLPKEFKEYFDYVLNLKFDETPNYNKLRRIMKELFLDEGFDYNFDWVVSDIDSNKDLDEDTSKESSLQNVQGEDPTTPGSKNASSLENEVGQ